MSVDANYLANAQRLVSQALAGTSPTTIGDTATDSSLVLANASIVNASASPVTVTLSWYDAAEAALRTIWKGSVAAGETAGSANMPLPIPMREGDEIRATGAASVHINLVYVMQLTTGR